MKLICSHDAALIAHVNHEAAIAECFNPHGPKLPRAAVPPLPTLLMTALSRQSRSTSSLRTPPVRRMANAIDDVVLPDPPTRLLTEVELDTQARTKNVPLIDQANVKMSTKHDIVTTSWWSHVVRLRCGSWGALALPRRTWVLLVLLVVVFVWRRWRATATPGLPLSWS